MKMKQQKMKHQVLDIINQCDSNGYSPLFVAAQNDHTKVVTLLLQNNVCHLFIFNFELEAIYHSFDIYYLG